MKTTPQEIPKISKEWYGALAQPFHWINYEKPGEFPITIRYTFNLTLSHLRYGADGKEWRGHPITALAERTRKIVREKLALWEKHIGDYFHFEELNSVARDVYEVLPDGTYNLKKSMVNTLHFFHHGKVADGVPTGLTYVVREGNQPRFASCGIASDIVNDTIYLKTLIAHEIGHLWEKHPLKNHSNDPPPFIDEHEFLPDDDCTKTVMMYTKQCKPAMECVAEVPRGQKVAHCAKYLPQGPMLLDVKVVEVQHAEKYASWKKMVEAGYPKQNRLKGDLGDDSLINNRLSHNISTGTAVVTTLANHLPGTVEQGATKAADVASSVNPVLATGLIGFSLVVLACATYAVAGAADKAEEMQKDAIKRADLEHQANKKALQAQKNEHTYSRHNRHANGKGWQHSVKSPKQCSGGRGFNG